MIDHVIWPPKYDPKISALYRRAYELTSLIQG